MNFFKKKKPLPDAVPELSLEATSTVTAATEDAGESPAQDSPPAYNAETVIGGLGWYRSQYQRAMKLALGLLLVLCGGHCTAHRQTTHTALFRGHARSSACAADSAG